jgi:hypothetical protein
VCAFRRKCSYVFTLLIIIVISLILLGDTRVWTQGFPIARLALYHLSCAFDPFHSDSLKDRVSFFPDQPGLPSSYFMLPTIAGMTCMCHHIQLLVDVGSHKLFAWGWPQTIKKLLIYTSWVARITDVSCQPLAINNYYSMKLDLKRTEECY